jgi:hypothetical protein
MGRFAEWSTFLIAVGCLGGCFGIAFEQGDPQPVNEVDAGTGSSDSGTPACKAGQTLQDGVCIDADECATGANDCSPDATCTNEPGTYSCHCNDGFLGDGRTCMKACTTVLIYSDCPATSTSCDSSSDVSLADNAAMGLGLTVKQGAVGNESAFRTLFDAGGFDVVVFEGERVAMETDTANRLAVWIANGGRAIVTYWNLDNDTTGKLLRVATGTVTTASLTTPLDIYADPTSPVNLFDRLERVPSPLLLQNVMADDGDKLALNDNTGFLAGRHNSATGAGAIAVTRSRHAITLGFLPVSNGFPTPRDSDADGKPDIQELYTNMLGFLCGK